MLHWLLWPQEALWDVIYGSCRQLQGYELEELGRKQAKHPALSPCVLPRLPLLCWGVTQ